jgi:hypothetical protein
LFFRSVEPRAKLASCVRIASLFYAALQSVDHIALVDVNSFDILRIGVIFSCLSLSLVRGDSAQKRLIARGGGRGTGG